MAAELVLTDYDMLHAGTCVGDLKPCPFCGKPHPLTSTRRNEEFGNSVVRISCPGRGALVCCEMFTCVKTTEEQKGRETLAARWNTRATVAE